MTIIEKFTPLNNIEKINSLITTLKNIPGAMNIVVRNEIYQNIKKAKLQLYFNNTYPESYFNDNRDFIPSAQETDKTDSNDESNKDVSNYNLLDKYIIDYLPKETQTNKKYVYGTYIEMAFHNYYLTFHHIYALVFGENLMTVSTEYYKKNNLNEAKPSLNDDYACEWAVWTPMFNRFENAKPEQQEHFIYLSRKHFPFLKALQKAKAEKQLKEIIDVLKSFSYVLRELRNVYSHFVFAPSQVQENKYKNNLKFVETIIHNLFNGAKREVKERFGFDENKMECVNNFEENKNRHRDKFGKIPKYIQKTNFRYALFSQKNNKQNITTFGIIFLTCLFLEKQYARIFSDKTKCIINTDKEVVCELISVYRIRLHIQKLDVSMHTNSIALDIINELRRCPKPLFEMLPSDEQQKFRIKPDSPEEQDVLMVRHTDRFASLLLKYIDDAKIFEKIRFQVSLGRYFFRFYDKKCIDSTGDCRVRSICKDVNGFGRITQIEETRKEKYSNVIRKFEDIHKNTSDDKPYITEHHAQYIINNNKIGIYIRKEDNPQSILPELTPTGVRNTTPTCWLSTYELPALAFLLHLYNADGTRIEDIIQSTFNNYHRLFSDIRDGKVCPVSDESELDVVLKKYGNIKRENLPGKMIDYLLSKNKCVKEIYNKWALSKLQKMIEHTERLLNNIQNDLRNSNDIKNNQLGKKSHITIKPGRIADFLAHDFMYFQPHAEGGNNKLTGLNFQILQSTLAVYDGNFEQLSRILTNAHIIGKPNDELCNPIVMDVCRKNKYFKNIIYFYIEYLKARKNYLTQCIANNNFESLSFLHPAQNKWNERSKDYYRTLAARYLTDEYGGVSFDKSIELPRGLFEPYIRKELSEMDAMKGMAYDNTKNIAYLIYGYMVNVMNDDSQSFYDTKRTYQLFNVLYRKSPRDGKVYYDSSKIRQMLLRNNDNSIRKDITKYISKTIASERANEQERCNALFRKLKNTETELKLYKIQDILLFLIAKRILLDNQNDKESNIKVEAINHIHLKSITDGNTLSQKISISMDILGKNGYKKTILQNGIKLKNYSHLYSIISDRRLPSLLNLINYNVINKTDLDDELKNYNKCHPSVLNSIFEYEKQYIEHNNFEKIPDLKTMLENSNVPKEKYVEIKTIRNSFAHQSYPDRSIANTDDVNIPHKAEIISSKLINSLKNANSH